MLAGMADTELKRSTVVFHLKEKNEEQLIIFWRLTQQGVVAFQNLGRIRIGGLI